MAYVVSRAERIGVNVYHPAPAGGECYAWVGFAGAVYGDRLPVAAWRVEQSDPLTLAPEIRCRACGDCGYIRGGRWVRA